ncbi:T9SS type A sorting domain-containing protein [candidate division WOR-3 bacterium]|nr:T9SS type A sorting domain-containing protein [candidate division WOR-3 bacterium]
MHINSSYTYLGMFLQEARDRMYSYPPPYWYGSYWTYVTPWLWIDGSKNGSYTYNTWANKIGQRLDVHSPFTITMWGDWHPAAGTGTIYAQFRNDSTVALTGKVLFVVTEDSIYKPAPNGDQWHNHVARDYLPTASGEVVTIPPGDSLTLSRAFVLDTIWNADKIRFTTWIQDLNMQPDTTIEIWQGAMLDIDELGIMEYTGGEVTAVNIKPVPNPCASSTRFAFTLPAGERYQIGLFDVSGRKVRVLAGTATGNEESVEWNLRNETGRRVSAGVYLYQFESASTHATGKVVVR